MQRILEDLYLTRMEFLDRMEDNVFCNEAKIALCNADKALRETLTHEQGKLFTVFLDAQEELCDQRAASAFAAGYRLRAMLSAALIDL